MSAEKLKMKKYKNNPILSPILQNKWESKHVYNAGVTIYDDKVYILYRAEGDEERKFWNDFLGPAVFPVSRLGLAISEDGYHISERLPEPVLGPTGELDMWGIEDPRITRIENTYYIVYTICSPFEGKDKLALATTEDFKEFKRIGPIMEDIAQRTAALIPEKFNGMYALIHRIRPNIRLSFTKDFKSWSNSQVIMKTRINSWEENYIGIGPPPIKTEKGWLVFYHGVDRYYTYRVGVALLDLNNPAKVIKRLKEPILEPEEEYEVKGTTPNVVYPCGVVEKEGKYLLYYGAADTVLCVAEIDKDELLQNL